MKKIVALTLSVALIFTCLCVTSVNTFAVEPTANIVYGDATGDNKVDSDDLFRLLDYLASYDANTSEYLLSIPSSADTNDDGKVDSDDLFELLDYLASYDANTQEYTKHLGPEGSEIVLPVVVF